MKVVIPAAGVGTRLRPHTLTLPKPLLPVAGSRIIDLIMDEVLAAANVEEVVFIIGYLGDVLKAYITEHYPNVKTSFIVQQEFKGLGHAISLTKDHIDDDDDLLIVLGDMIGKVDLGKVLKDRVNYLGVEEVEDPSSYGVAIMEGEYIQKLVEKPDTPISNLALAGLYYIVNGRALYKSLDYIIEHDIRTKNEFQVTDALQHMIEGGTKFKVFKLDGIYDCGKKEVTLDTNRRLITHTVGNATLTNAVVIPPCAIADGVTIENAVVGPHVHVGKNTVIKKSVIENAIIDENARIENACITESIIGAHAEHVGRKKEVSLGAYTIVE